MKHAYSSSLVSLFLSLTAFNSISGQTDSLQALQEVVVQAYLHRQPVLQIPASVGIVNAIQLNRRAGASLLPALNQVPGLRMEERSPGSYRLSIRGSLLRSPFGVRNVKVYLGAFPLTDAGGNTYLNLIDPKGIERIEVLKGPDGSLFGANSGGVVLMDLNGTKKASSGFSLGLNGGAYGLFHENATLQIATGKSRFSINQACQRADGYRENSAMQRHYLQAAERWSYGKNHRLDIVALYADLQYQTPGGLTQEQFEANARQARPASGANPGAVAQKAGVRNRTFFGGISNEVSVAGQLRWVAAVFGAGTHFENPFITNFETRKETNLGLRSFLEWQGKAGVHTNWKWNLGLEGQTGDQAISNYQNNGGAAGDLLAQDALRLHTVFYFTRFSTTFGRKWLAEGAVSLNHSRFSYSGGQVEGRKTLDKQWMPRLALSFLPIPNLALRATLGRGYSPPTPAEIRPSNNRINPDLQAESGWNREAGIRLTAWHDRLEADAAVFRYDLTNAIVRRTDAAGAEYFINAGGTQQTGIEAFAALWLIAPRSSGLLRALQLNGSYTHSRFFFRNYQVGSTDYSGNRLTGVPRSVGVGGVLLHFPLELHLFTELNFTARLPLNDANTAYAKAYRLLQTKLSWSKLRFKNAGLTFFVGADNLLNETYSLGNDINAFGGRYFNAAAPLNFYGGLIFSQSGTGGPGR